MQRSRILYRIRLNVATMESILLSVGSLPCTETSHLDEDLFMLRDSRLVSFSITINMVKVKYYSLEG